MTTYDKVRVVSKTLSAVDIAGARTRHTVQRASSNYVGRRLIRVIEDVRGLTSLLLITVGVTVTKYRTARKVVHPLIRKQLARAGFDLLPMVAFLSFALGMVVIGQTVLLMSRIGAEGYMGMVMVTAVVRELGPMLAALLVLARVGAANVIELGTARALGEVEALEALGIDPIHYLVVPRFFGMAMASCALTVYLILFALCSGYLFVFIEGVPLRPEDYFGQLAGALLWQDFVLLVFKTMAFGAFISIVACYEGLAQRIRLEDVSRATTAAVATCVVGLVLMDGIFILVYHLIV